MHLGNSGYPGAVELNVSISHFLSTFKTVFISVTFYVFNVFNYYLSVFTSMK